MAFSVHLLSSVRQVRNFAIYRLESVHHFPFNQIKPRTMPQRTRSRAMNTMTIQVTVFSSERMNSDRPRNALVRLQGMKIRQKTASSVPTALARSEFFKSPRTSNAKLVVMPQEGQGSPVTSLKLQGGKPSCVWVSIRRGLPFSYGSSRVAV